MFLLVFVLFFVVFCVFCFVFVGWRVFVPLASSSASLFSFGDGTTCGFGCLLLVFSPPFCLWSVVLWWFCVRGCGVGVAASFFALFFSLFLSLCGVLLVFFVFWCGVFCVFSVACFLFVVLCFWLFCCVCFFSLFCFLFGVVLVLFVFVFCCFWLFCCCVLFVVSFFFGLVVFLLFVLRWLVSGLVVVLVFFSPGWFWLCLALVGCWFVCFVLLCCCPGSFVFWCCLWCWCWCSFVAGASFVVVLFFSLFCCGLLLSLFCFLCVSFCSWGWYDLEFLLFLFWLFWLFLLLVVFSLCSPGSACSLVAAVSLFWLVLLPPGVVASGSFFSFNGSTASLCGGGVSGCFVVFLSLAVSCFCCCSVCFVLSFSDFSDEVSVFSGSLFSFFVFLFFCSCWGAEHSSDALCFCSHVEFCLFDCVHCCWLWVKSFGFFRVLGVLLLRRSWCCAFLRRFGVHLVLFSFLWFLLLLGCCSLLLRLPSLLIFGRFSLLFLLLFAFFGWLVIKFLLLGCWLLVFLRWLLRFLLPASLLLCFYSFLFFFQLFLLFCGVLWLQVWCFSLFVLCFCLFFFILCVRVHACMRVYVRACVCAWTRTWVLDLDSASGLDSGWGSGVGFAFVVVDGVAVFCSSWIFLF